MRGSILSLLLRWRRGPAGPARVILIRHAEKPRRGAHLSARGHARAAALINYFCSEEGRAEFGPLAAIYAAAPKRDGSSVRPSETVAPLAAALGLEANSKFRRGDYAALAAELRNDPRLVGQTVLIAWVHGSLPALARALGARGVPKRWDDRSYDRTWSIRYPPGGRPELTIMRQRLLPEDE